MDIGGPRWFDSLMALMVSATWAGWPGGAALNHRASDNTCWVAVPSATCRPARFTIGAARRGGHVLIAGCRNPGGGRGFKPPLSRSSGDVVGEVADAEGGAAVAARPGQRRCRWRWAGCCSVPRTSCSSRAPHRWCTWGTTSRVPNSASPPQMRPSRITSAADRPPRHPSGRRVRRRAESWPVSS